MPSVFENMVTSALSPFYAMYGLPATYTAPDGTVTAGITVRLHRNEFREVPAEVKASGQMQTGELLVRKSELARPVKGGVFKVESVEIWTIENNPTFKNGELVCAVMRAGTDRLMERRAKDA